MKNTTTPNGACQQKPGFKLWTVFKRNWKVEPQYRDLLYVVLQELNNKTTTAAQHHKKTVDWTNEIMDRKIYETSYVDAKTPHVHD